MQREDVIERHPQAQLLARFLLRGRLVIARDTRAGVRLEIRTGQPRHVPIQRSPAERAHLFRTSVLIQEPQLHAMDDWSGEACSGFSMER